MIISICINELYKEINQVVLEILPKYRMETTLGKQMYLQNLLYEGKLRIDCKYSKYTICPGIKYKSPLYV